MSIRNLLFLAYGAAGLGISVVTAIMTYLIIGEPIGWYMFSEIAAVVLLTLPVIWWSSRRIGGYFSGKIEEVKERLHGVMEERTPPTLSEASIEEFARMHRDIEALRLRLQAHVRNLEAKNRSQRQMMRSLAHDMNTPLTIIGGYLEELEDGIGEPSETVRVIRKETDYLQELSRDVVDYLRSMQEGRPQEPIVLKTLLDDELFGLLRPAKEVRLGHTVPPEATILFNRVDLKKLLFNLLHNSCKFTETGRITVGYDGSVLSVSDTGCGIPDAALPTLFEPMSAVSEAQERTKGGFGMGLSVAANLARSNGYRLELFSTSPEGSAFDITAVDNE